MENVVNFINTTLDPIGIVIGLILAFPVFSTWYHVTIGRRRRERKWLAEVMRPTNEGSRPAILIVDLLPGNKDILSGVERFRSTIPELRAIPKERVFRIVRQKELGPEDMLDLARKIRDVAAKVYRSGTDVLYYFHGGPFPTAAMVGAEFTNGCRVYLYQWNRETYINWGPLRHRLEGG